ncbi:MAG: hypothetical protein IKZ96_02055 [Bacilli bacterium]|nr:hypothetical protein [Bacilli bacterium]
METIYLKKPELQRDIWLAEGVLKGKIKKAFSWVYGNTNEDLEFVFENVNVKNKNVLTVLSSSDYLFMAHLFGAKTVDCFDINPLAHRLFFLRKWLLQAGYIDLGFCNYKKLETILNSVTTTYSQYEKDSLVFWKTILPKMKDNLYHSDLIITPINPLDYFYSKRMDELVEITRTMDPNFQTLDIRSESGFDTDKEYDYVFLSNILDYNRFPDRLETIKKNILPVLSSKGKIVCTHIPFYNSENYFEVMKEEREIFRKEFSFKPIDEQMIDRKHAVYQYTRKNQKD